MTYLKKIKPLILEAGKIITSAQKQELKEKTNHQDLVTQYDVLVQNFLVENLKELYPDHGFLLEEESSDNHIKEYNFIIDPIDGTTNFIHDLSFSSISIAVAYKDERIIAALVLNPYNNELFTAEENKGCYLNDQKVTVSNRSFKEATIGFGVSPYNRTYLENTYEVVKKCMLDCRETRRMGSAALDLAYVACGRFDGFFEYQLAPWDFAAGYLLIKEAGGTITNFKLEQPSFYQKTSIVAGNPKISNKIAHYVKDTNKS